MSGAALNSALTSQALLVHALFCFLKSKFVWFPRKLLLNMIKSRFTWFLCTLFDVPLQNWILVSLSFSFCDDILDQITHNVRVCKNIHKNQLLLTQTKKQGKNCKVGKKSDFCIILHSAIEQDIIKIIYFFLLNAFLFVWMFLINT